MAFTEEVLKDASNKLEYHVNMYAKTYIWLQNKETWDRASIPAKVIYSLKFLPRSIQWLVPQKTRNLVSNSVEESHLVHARILYEFLAKPKQKNYEKTDIRANDFYESKSDYELLVNQYLKDMSFDIGGRGFHLTTKHLTAKISDHEWPFDDIARQLLQSLRDYFDDPLSSKLRKADREKCLEHLDLLEYLIT